VISSHLLLCRSLLLCSVTVDSFFCCVFVLFFLFFFLCSGVYLDLHSFPTRRSSDLFVVLGEGRVGGIASRNEAYDAAGHTERGSPNGAINRTRANAIEWNIDPLVLCRIHRLIDIYERVTLAVTVGVEDERSPTLRLLFVLGL